MSDAPYSNREIDEHFREIKEMLTRIETQTTKTNGRVNKLESWKSLLIGGWIIVTLFVIPLVVAFNNLSSEKIETKLDTHIDSDSKNWGLVFEKLGL